MGQPDQVRRLLALLIRASPLTQRQVEERLGVSRGYLWRLGAGKVPLTAKRLLEILDIIGMPAVEFACAAFLPDCRESHPLLQALIRERPEIGVVVPERRDLPREILEALYQALTGKPAPPDF